MGPNPDRPRGVHALKHWFVAGALAALAPLALGGCGQSAGTDYASTWGPSIGSQTPLLAAIDQDGNPQTLETLSKAKGVLVVFNRSVDW